MASRVATVVGTRPQLIKAVPVSVALRSVGLEEFVIDTDQHHDAEMSQIFYDELNWVEPFLRLGIHGGSHAQMTARMLPPLEDAFRQIAPDIVLVYGDTNTTLAASLVAAKLSLPIAHVEAGMRSFDRRMPEEVNRVVCDHLSNVLFVPTRAAVQNLEREGITRDVHLVGDVMYDAALWASSRVGNVDPPISLGADEPYVLVTIHRAENTDDPARLERVLSYVRREAAGRRMVLPVHPRLARAVREADVALTDFDVVSPQGFLSMARLTRGADLVLTDSGGLQKEAYFHRVRCVTLRDSTEWVETIEAGWNRLWTTAEYAPRREIEDYGDGKASQRIAAILQQSGSPSPASA